MNHLADASYEVASKKYHAAAFARAGVPSHEAPPSAIVRTTGAFKLKPTDVVEFYDEEAPAKDETGAHVVIAGVAAGIPVTLIWAWLLVLAMIRSVVRAVKQQ